MDDSKRWMEKASNQVYYVGKSETTEIEIETEGGSKEMVGEN